MSNRSRLFSCRLCLAVLKPRSDAVRIQNGPLLHIADTEEWFRGELDWVFIDSYGTVV